MDKNTDKIQMYFSSISQGFWRLIFICNNVMMKLMASARSLYKMLAKKLLDRTIQIYKLFPK